MLKANKTHVLVLMIFTFSFLYRMLLILWDGYPPGADIGLHNSVIYSITGHGNVDFFYNFYHMGSGLSLTFPGYHIFTSSIMLMTGLTEYVAHAVVVSLFSSLIVLAAFLITKKVWSEPAAYAVAFLAAISRFDIEMLLWAGYPNVITLMLIPVTFYLYLQRDRFSKAPFLAATSILAGSIFLTHSLSAAIFVGITFLTVLFVLIRPKRFGTTRKKGVYWILPIVLGAILVAPFVIEAVPVYLNNNSTLATDQASAAIEEATIGTRVLPLWLVLPLFGVPVGFLVFSKKYFGRFLTLPTLLLIFWVLVPLVLTQSYLAKFPVDYNRFLYFLILPLIIFVGVFIENGASFFAKKIDNHYHNNASRVTNRRIGRFLVSLKRKNFYSGFILLFLLFSFVVLPIFMSPIYYNTGQSIQSFYQTMTDQGWEAINWAKANTPTDAVFVSDALYGWWLGGFAQRRTYSAVDPQYLSINEEYDKAVFARTLLDTDYLIDNGLVQVREDGGYIARHNPQILATLNWTYFPYTFFNFASNETTIEYTVNGSSQSSTLAELTVKDMQMESDAQHATISVTRGNDCLNYTQLTTVYKGLRFINLTTTVESTVPLQQLQIDVQIKGEKIQYDNDRTVGLIDEPVKTLGQLIFIENQPEEYNVDPIEKNGTRRAYLQYDLQGETQGDIQISASAYSVSDNLELYSTKEKRDSFLGDLITINLENQSVFDVPFEQVFDYRAEEQRYNVSYIVCRIPEIFPKFLRDPQFSLVFFNNGTNTEVINEIAIFKVN